MRKLLKCTLTSLVLLFIIIFLPTSYDYASDDIPENQFPKSYDYEQTHNGNIVRVDDKADLLSEEEMQDVINEMIKVSKYADVFFLSTKTNIYMSENSYITNYLSKTNSGDDVLVFLIDMDTRKIQLYAKGAPSTKISSEDCNIITDNVYRKASKEKYGDCAASAFRQSYQLLIGQAILKPMKYIGCALLAFMLSIMINYLMAVTTSTVNQSSISDVPAGIFSEFDIKKGDYEVLRTTRRFTPDTSNRGHGGSFSGGSGGGGGGGFSSGGHSF